MPVTYNLNQVYLHVVRNKGFAGVDGMIYDQLLPDLKEHREELLMKLHNGIYCLKPVLWVEILKPDSDVKKLGIPTVIDRMIQQVINPVVLSIFDQRSPITALGFA